MIVSTKTAKRMIASGRAAVVGLCYDPEKDSTYAILNNTHAQRTDHYMLASGDIRPAEEHAQAN